MPARRSYDWPRFWVLPGAIDISGDGGFFPDPNGSNIFVSRVPAVRLDEAVSQRVLVLLAEPGLGKTRAVEDHLAAPTSLLSSTARTVRRRLDLGAFDNASSLRTALVEHEVWREWHAGDHELELWLDSFDEALLHVRAVEKMVLHELGELDPSQRARLRLRVVCRSADWSDAFEQSVGLLWPDEPLDGVVLRLQLAPLRRLDVATAATANALDADAFIDQLRERGLEQLAAQPLTLVMLLETASSHGELPADQKELLYRGSRLLCEEPDRRRRDMPERLHAGQRLAIAERVAATTLLAGRAAVTAETTKPVGREVRISEISGGHERDPDAGGPASLRVEVSHLQETLGSALFQADGTRYRFVHRVFAEFLAARWLVGRGFDAEQILSLLVAPHDGADRLVPQLREVTAWVVAMRPDLLGDVLRHEPDVVVRIEQLELNSDDRSDVVVALLGDEETAERIPRFGSRSERALRALAHPGLVDQIRRPIRDTASPLAVRQLAISLAKACAAAELQDDLLVVALDDEEPAYLRDDVVSALDELADDTVRAKLIPLALQPQVNDQDDEIKARALRAVCPRLVSPVELLPTLTAPKNPQLIGSYRMFLLRGLPQAFVDDELPAALDWVATMREEWSAPQLVDLGDRIIAAAWRRLDQPGIPQALWPVLVARLRADGDLLRGSDRTEFEVDFGDGRLRRNLLPLLAAASAGGDFEPFWAVHSSPALLAAEDVPWLLAKLEASTAVTERAAFARLIDAAFDPARPERDAVLLAAEGDPVLAEAMKPWTEPVSLDSELARHHRERLFKRFERDAPPEDAPDMAAEVADRLSRAESGDLESWWVLNWILTFDEYGRPSGVGELEPDLRQLPGWVRMGDEQHDRALDAAKQYLCKADPQPAKWFGTTTGWKPAMAGYRALCLVANADPEWLDSKPGVWPRWASIVVGYPLANFDTESMHRDLLERALAAAPQNIARWFVRKLDADDEGEAKAFGLWRLRGVTWPTELLRALEEKAEDPSLTAESRAAVVEQVLVNDPSSGFKLAIGSLADAEPREDDLRARLITLLLRFAPVEGWPYVAPALADEPVVGRLAIELIFETEREGVGQQLKDEALSAFIGILYELFPPHDDPPWEAGARWEGRRDQITRFRDGLVSVLAGRGSRTAVDAVAKLAEAFPGHDLLRYRLRDARDAHRAQWPAPSPGDIVRLAETTDARIVTSARHLQLLTRSSLRRASAALQGSPPRVQELWNQRPVRPKDEGQLSDWLQAWLEQDLRVGGRFVGRELQVRPSASGRGRGEDVDLTVSAAVGEHVEAAETVHVRIEVKGSWNPGLDTAMGEQLAARYLHPASVAHGLYVVGDFDAAQWDAEDGRRSVSRRQRQGLRDRLAKQAERVSVSYGVSVESAVLDVALPKPGRA